MKKALCFVLAVLLLFSVSLAESVTQMDYELVRGDSTRLGKYTGEVLNNRPNGYGIFVSESSSGLGWHYIGDWRDGIMDGTGATYWEDGSLEIGFYEDGFFVYGYGSYDGTDLSLYVADTFDRSLIQEDEAEATPTESPVQYIGNKNSKVFHRLTCGSVEDMSEKNKVEFLSRDEAIDLGYKPCSRCKP